MVFTAIALQSSLQSIAAVGIFGFAIALFVVGILIGVWLLESDRRGIVWGVPFWCLQIPLVSSKPISYQFATGAFINLAATADVKLELNAEVGSTFSLALLPDAPLVVGVNLLACAVSILLWKHRGSL